MGFALNDGVHFCLANDQTTFIDLKSGRYLALPPASDQAFHRMLANDTMGPTDLEQIDDLLAAGVLKPSPTDQPPRQTVPPAAPIADRLDDPARLNPWLMARAVLIQFRVRRELRRAPLKAVLDDLAQRRQNTRVSRPLADARDAGTVISSYLQTRSIIPIKDQCLPWSMAMARYLVGLGFEAQLILGVRRKPWGAHAWVQAGDTVLSDYCDIVRPFTPILVA